MGTPKNWALGSVRSIYTLNWENRGGQGEQTPPLILVLGSGPPPSETHRKWGKNFEIVA